MRKALFAGGNGSGHMRFVAFVGCILLAVNTAGCLDDFVGNEGAASAERDTRPLRATSPDMPGVIAEGVYHRVGPSHTVFLNATQEGDRTYHVHAMCVEPWVDVFEPSNVREPRVVCEAIGSTPFEPGERIAWTGAWDETVWDADAGRYVDAPPGEYRWIPTFRAWSDDEFRGEESIPVEILITVT